ncbi:MBOAT family O-acyltransferase [uncultured Faecalicoccus sp.]|uniref:MBOAT family O-acyltransferase n=1 Tax=uncultured Faecalicoccus sp. TaxID=1971760 RepID=UPI00260FD9D5|nr:MBOAT family O-acyltransferase [uncultured Faecalicoccus sp.]
MVFNSLIFVFCFLPVSVFLYWIVPGSFVKNVVLFVLSLLFYAWNEPFYLILLLLNIAWNYLSALELGQEEDEKKRKIVFWITIAVNLLLLGAFKYTNFLLGIFGIAAFDVSLPVGLSFFTFSAISYIADVYKGTSPAQKNPLDLGLYIAFFGKITSGPIAFYHDMENQLAYRPLSKELFFSGVCLFAKGLIKKVLLADQFALVFSALSANTSMLGAWIYAISYMLEIYFDFSGYSDMAIGIGRMFGFTMKPNFDHPYSAISVQDFWRRWHISLSSWFRDYVYIPLGGNRHDYVRNILIVWFLTGLWHGANWTFILWGLYYGGILLLEKFVLKPYLQTLPKIICHLYTLVLVLIGWVFFFSPGILEAFSTLGRMINVVHPMDSQVLFVLFGNLPLFILGVLFSGTLYDRVFHLFMDRSPKRASAIYTFLYVLFFVVCIAFMVGSTYQSFLYFAF